MTEARSAPPPIAEPQPASIPATPAGQQLGWFLDATRSLPILVPDIEAHFSADLLAEVPPDQLNVLLVQAGYSTLIFLRVVSATEMSIDATVDPGTGGPPAVLSLTVGVDGRIIGIGLGAKFVPLPPRADRGLAPVSLPRPTGRFAVGTETLVVTPNLWSPAVCVASAKRSVSTSPFGEVGFRREGRCAPGGSLTP